MKLLQTVNDLDYKEFNLCNDNEETITSFDVEINNHTALISYVTKEMFRNQGYGSLGLNMVKDTLFCDSNILFLELINLSNDYSRKVAENAGFFSPGHNIDYYIALNPKAEELLEQQLNQLDSSSQSYRRQLRLLEKVKRLRAAENSSKEELQNKLQQLLQEDVEGIENYKKYVDSEAHHLQGIVDKNINSKKR